jgi:hypothetical protein
LIEIIDSLIPAPKRKISIGQVVQSMVLNALGFSNRAMYLHFFPVKHRLDKLKTLRGLSYL